MKNKYKPLVQPNQFVPRIPRELLGNAGSLAASILCHTLYLKRESKSHLKTCFWGPPGTGKTTIANMTAEALVSHPMSIERQNGRDVTIDLVRDWQRGAAYSSMFGGWTVKIINELDLVPMAAQELMLSYLDQLPPLMAVIGTSNENTDTLSRRFMSRFQLIKIQPPKPAALRNWLRKRWGIPAKVANWITLSSCGNIREALLQSASYMQFGVLPDTELSKPRPAVKDSSRVGAAKKYWEEVRAGLRPAPGTATA